MYYPFKLNLGGNGLHTPFWRSFSIIYALMHMLPIARPDQRRETFTFGLKKLLIIL